MQNGLYFPYLIIILYSLYIYKDQCSQFLLVLLVDNVKRYKTDICTTRHDNEVFDDAWHTPTPRRTHDTTPAFRRCAHIRVRGYRIQHYRTRRKEISQLICKIDQIDKKHALPDLSPCIFFIFLRTLTCFVLCDYCVIFTKLLYFRNNLRT